MSNANHITKVSEYIAQGGFATNQYLIESPVKETEKAYAFQCVQINSFGNPYNGLAWLPKSKLTKIENDFYTDGPKEMFLCPGWLYSKAFRYGEVKVA